MPTIERHDRRRLVASYVSPTPIFAQSLPERRRSFSMAAMSGYLPKEHAGRSSGDPGAAFGASELGVDLPSWCSVFWPTADIMALRWGPRVASHQSVLEDRLWHARSRGSLGDGRPAEFTPG